MSEWAETVNQAIRRFLKAYFYSMLMFFLIHLPRNQIFSTAEASYFEKETVPCGINTPGTCFVLHLFT